MIYKQRCATLTEGSLRVFITTISSMLLLSKRPRGTFIGWNLHIFPAQFLHSTNLWEYTHLNQHFQNNSHSLRMTPRLGELELSNYDANLSDTTLAVVVRECCGKGFFGLGTDAEVGVGFGEGHAAIAGNNVGGGDGQALALVAIDEGDVDEDGE